MYTKRQIKSIFKRKKYYDASLTLLEDEFKKVGESEKEMRRFEKESWVVQRLMAVSIYNQLPTTYDIVKNPYQILTKQECKVLVSNSKTKEDGMFKRGMVVMIYMPEEEFNLFLEIYKELT